MKPTMDRQHGDERISVLLQQKRRGLPAPRVVWPFRSTAVLALSCLALPAWCQTFPAKPIRMIVPFDTGGSIDLLARLVGRKMGEALGTPVVIDNRTGAGGVIGVRAIVGAAPDGYTIGIVSPGPMTLGVALQPKLPYNLSKDFTYVAALASYVGTVLVSPQLPVKTVKELIAYAKQNPGKLTYGSSGVGSSVHIMGELFVRAAGIEAVHVPYRGGGPVIQETIGGRISLGMTSLAATGPLIKAGKAHALTVFDRERYVTFPEIPAVTEDLPSFDPPVIWYGLIGPAGIPSQITERLNREAVRALSTPELQSEIIRGAYKVIGGSPRDFQELIRKDAISMAEVVRAAHIKLEE